MNTKERIFSTGSRAKLVVRGRRKFSKVSDYILMHYHCNTYDYKLEKASKYIHLKTSQNTNV